MNQRKKNHLDGEPGAYLEQHSTNLVDWYPYREEALEKAKREDKPIFLSIGYASCHWCHVMEHESFADNEEIASILNQNFVSIKVDRELQPDVDAYYQEINSMFGKSGGWPLSIFVTPDLKPIFTGTYFPGTAKYGMPGFATILNIILDTYQNKKDQIEEINRKIIENKEMRRKKAIEEGKRIKQDEEKKKKDEEDKKLQEKQENEGLFGDIAIDDSLAVEGHDLDTQIALAAQKENPLGLTHNHFSDAFTTILNQFDQRDGGFAGAPKFPQFAIYDFLFNHFAKSENDGGKLRDLIKKTLDIMAYRGLYDQVGGGFHRYSVDGQWIIPHFEKMLYDNAIALTVYSKAARLYGSDDYLAVAIETAEFLIRELKGLEGLFQSGIDADAAGKEGDFHVWSIKELEESLSPKEFEFMKNHFEISKGGNFEGKNQLVWKDKEWMPADPTWMLIKRKLRTIREKRHKPAIINNLIASWNALTGIGFLDLYTTTKDKQYLKIAKTIAEAIEKYLIKFKGDEIVEMKRVLGLNLEAKNHATLDDVAYTSKLFLMLYEITEREEYAKRSEALVKFGIQYFADPESPEIHFSGSYGNPLDIKVEGRHADEPLPAPAFVLYETAIRLQLLAKSVNINAEMEKLKLFGLYTTDRVLANSPWYGAGLVALQWSFYGYQPFSVIASKPALFRFRNKLKLIFVPYYQLKFTNQEGFGVYGQSDGKQPKNYNLYINYCHDTLCSVILGTPKQAIARILKEIKNVNDASGGIGDLKFNSFM